jgi:hypothetical protein
MQIVQAGTCREPSYGLAPAVQIAAIRRLVERSLGSPGFRKAQGSGHKPTFTRQLAMYLARTRLELSYAAIGRAFDRDRTTVAHACAVIEDLREAASVDSLVCRIEEALDRRLSRLRVRD